MLATNPHVDLPHAIPLPFGHVVDQVELTGLLEEPRIGADIGKHESPSAVNVAHEVQIILHLRLVEGLAVGELEVACQELVLELAVADKRDVANRVSRPLVDDEGEHRPIAAGAADRLDFPAHLGLKEAEAAVVGRERVNVGVDLFTIDVATKQPEEARLRFDLRQEPSVVGNRVAHEARPEGLFPQAFVDEKYGPLVAQLASFHRGHAGGVVALLVVIRLQPSPCLFHDIGIHRVANLDFTLLGEGAGRHPLVADEPHVANRGPLNDLEDHHHALANAYVFGMDVDKLP